MENTYHQVQATRSYPIGLCFGNGEPEERLSADSASFWTTLNRDATTTGRHTNDATGAADPNAWDPMSDEVDHHDEHAGISENRTSRKIMMTVSFVLTLSREEPRLLIQGKVWSAVEPPNEGR